MCALRLVALRAPAFGGRGCPVQVLGFLVLEACNSLVVSTMARCALGVGSLLLFSICCCCTAWAQEPTLRFLLLAVLRDALIVPYCCTAWTRESTLRYTAAVGWAFVVLAFSQPYCPRGFTVRSSNITKPIAGFLGWTPVSTRSHPLITPTPRT